MTECVFFLAMNRNGNWIVTKDENEPLTDLADNYGEDGFPARVVKVTVKMMPPIVTEVTVDVPNEAGTITVA